MQIEIENKTIHYHFYNSSPKNTDYIVLIHGLGLDLTMWDSIIPYLKEHFRVISFDMRGHGKTKADTTNLDWEVLVEDVYQLMISLGITTFHLVGLGFGGNLALKFNEQYPMMVKKLLLTSVYMFFPKNLTNTQINKRKQLAANGHMAELSKNMIHQICYNPTPEVELLLTKAYARVDLCAYFRMFHLLAETVQLEDLRKVDKEVLFIQGEKDPLFPIQQTNVYQSFSKNSIGYVVPNASNLVPLDNPQSFAKLTRNFFKDGDSSGFLSVMKQEMADSLYDLITIFDTLEINVMNGFSVKFNGMEIEDKWNQRKSKNLLAYLAYHNSVTREELIEEFWSEMDLVSARNNLRVSLNHLKSILSNHKLEHFLQIGRENISLVGNISSDLIHFMELLQVCETESDPLKKKSLFGELTTLYKERMFLDLYDDWVFTLQHAIDSRLCRIAKILPT